MVDKQGVLRAANALITDPYAVKLYETLMAVAALPRHLPIGIVGDAELLNPLLHQYHANRDVFDATMDIVDKKREERGLEPLRKEEEQKGFDKNAYQAAFMEQKRFRERRAANIENMRRPERDRLIGNARLEFMRQASAKWKQRRDEMVNNAREARGVDRLSKQDLQEVLATFWSQIDRELDDQEEAVRNRVAR